MSFKLINCSKIILSVVVVTVLCAGSVSAGWEHCFEENSSIIVRLLPKGPEERKAAIQAIFSHPKASLFDLSKSEIGDEDLPQVAYGLALRSMKENISPLKLLDINNKFISKQGVENLLSIFQNGVLINNKKEYPDVRQTVMKVPSQIDVTDELLEHWYEIAPTTFSGGLTIVE